jgi:hypothetical protein
MRLRFSLTTLLLFVLALALLMHLNFKPTTLSFADGGQYGYPIPFYRTFRAKEKSLPLSQLTQDQLDELREVYGLDFDQALSYASYKGLNLDDLALSMDRDRFLWLQFICNLVAWGFFLFVLLLIESYLSFHFSPVPKHLENPTSEQQKSEGPLLDPRRLK